MKNRGLLNPFPPSVKQFWAFEHPYSWSGENQNVEIHHILKRISSSIFNSIPVTHWEHSRGAIHTEAVQKMFLDWTFKYVTAQMKLTPGCYKLRKIDKEFLLYVKEKDLIEIPENGII